MGIMKVGTINYYGNCRGISIAIIILKATQRSSYQAYFCNIFRKKTLVFSMKEN